MRWRARLRHARRRFRRRLGLPRLSRRGALLILLAFVSLVFVSVTILANWATLMHAYAPRYYEPKDFQREELIERKR